MWSKSDPKIGLQTICDWHYWVQVERKIRENNKEVYFVNKIINCTGKKIIVNIELTKIKITVKIKFKWPNIDYPSFYLVGKH
jgi:hypothetical protein